jgi:hypothetical protein
VEFLLPLLFIVAFAIVIGRFSSRRRRAMEEEERRRFEAARGGEGGAPGGAAGMSPFGLFPFGGLFDLLSGPATWSRSFVFDERTGPLGRHQRRGAGAPGDIR